MTGGLPAVRSGDFLGVGHHVALVEGAPEAVAAAVAEAAADREPLHVSVHAGTPAERDKATAALREAGIRCAVDALVQPPAGAGCAAVLWAVTGDGTVRHPAPGTSRLDFAGGSLVRLGHLEPGAATGWAELTGRLRGLGLGLDQVWKTWSYLPVRRGGRRRPPSSSPSTSTGPRSSATPPSGWSRRRSPTGRTRRTPASPTCPAPAR